jgi:hypothetical protein
MALFVVLGILFFLALSFFLLQMQSRQFRFQTHKNFEEEKAFHTARAVADTYWTFCQEVFRNRSGCKKFFPDGASPSPFDPRHAGLLQGLAFSAADFEKKADIEQALQLLLGEVSEYTKVNVSGVFYPHSPVANSIEGRVALHIELQTAQRSFAFEFPREFKTAQVLPYVVSKFTLFVRETANPGQYNTIAKSLQEDEDPQGKQVLTLRHSSKSFVSSDRERWRASGWVYLGGNDVQIHLDGTHPCRRRSENFLFWPSFYFSSPGQDLPFAITDPLGGTKMRVRITPLGCIKDWKNEGTLQAVLGNRQVPGLEFSSCLRLFGSKDHFSPTRVIGNVFAQYILYASLIYDSNDDTIPDTIDYMGGKHRAIFPLPRLVLADQFKPPYAPKMLTTKGFDLQVDGTGLSGIPGSIGDLMPNYSTGANNDYVTFMTKLVSDFAPTAGVSAFNALYDHLFDSASEQGGKSFPAPRLFPATEYPNPGKNFVLPATQQGDGSLFQGDLSAFDPAEWYRAEQFPGFVYSSEAQFLGVNGPFKKLNQVNTILAPLVVRVKGSLTLPTPLKLEAPALIIVDQDITVNEVQASPNGSPLTLVSLNGSITVQGGKLAGVCLVAPAGTVTWSSPLQLKGTLCCQKLPPATIEKGGEILYDEALDPTSPEAAKKGLAVLLGPNIPQALKGAP